MLHFVFEYFNPSCVRKRERFLCSSPLEELTRLQAQMDRKQYETSNMTQIRGKSELPENLTTMCRVTNLRCLKSQEACFGCALDGLLDLAAVL